MNIESLEEVRAAVLAESDAPADQADWVCRYLDAEPDEEDALQRESDEKFSMSDRFAISNLIARITGAAMLVRIMQRSENGAPAEPVHSAPDPFDEALRKFIGSTDVIDLASAHAQVQLDLLTKLRSMIAEATSVADLDALISAYDRVPPVNMGKHDPPGDTPDWDLSDS